jgi:hypothetical protein
MGMYRVNVIRITNEHISKTETFIGKENQEANSILRIHIMSFIAKVL